MLLLLLQLVFGIGWHLQCHNFGVFNLHHGIFGLHCISIGFGKFNIVWAFVNNWMMNIFWFWFKQLKHIDANVLALSHAATVSLSNIFLYCFFGKMTTESYEQAADSLYDFDWHELPLKYRKYLVIMMIDAQQSLEYSGFGVAVLNLETFRKVIFI